MVCVQLFNFFSRPCFWHVCLTYLSFSGFVLLFRINSIIVGNKIGADGAKFISEGMKENKVITNLDLRSMFVFIFICFKCCFHLFLTYLSFS